MFLKKLKCAKIVGTPFQGVNKMTQLCWGRETRPQTKGAETAPQAQTILIYHIYHFYWPV